LLATGGNRQTATVFTALPLPLQVNAATGYSGGAIYGATVTFSDGGQGGSFSASSAAPMILPYVTWDYKSFPTMQKKAATGDNPKSSSVGGRVCRGDFVSLE
jgi:hypothetical protein